MQMRVLGIETSCDETAAAIVSRDAQGKGEILSSVTLGQEREHERFGGVVPEIAARAHLRSLDSIVLRALEEADCPLGEVDAVAATAGPGLKGGLIVGMMTAKGIAASAGKPFLAINHLEGHALTVRLTHGLEWPYPLLLASGGHTQILRARGLGDYERWGTTIDDALGEAFDKSAKLLSLPFPGGPAVEREAERGDPGRFPFSAPLLGKDTFNFSFSGLKTQLRRAAESLAPLSRRDVADLCASFQRAVLRIVRERVEQAIRRCERIGGGDRVFVAVGGVASNRAIRREIESLCRESGWRFAAPEPRLCSDNAAMIAWAALERREAGLKDSLDFAPRPRWPLDERSAPLAGGGRKGAKA